ncbi:DUF2255 family protein [Nocardia sp. NPDC058518]|uniref:DUF2255 family protein n=1 Tax=Nocardia sp. NPDC058518 TaxID=3346534 RepID=UPI003662F5C1
MTTWTPEELDSLGNAEELHIASRRPDDTLRPFVTIWVVRVDDDIYVRSAHGATNPWYRRAMAVGRGRIRASGVEHDVEFTTPPAEVTGDMVDDAYHAKYDRYGQAIVGRVTGADAHGQTIRLLRS